MFPEQIAVFAMSLARALVPRATSRSPSSRHRRSGI